MSGLSQTTPLAKLAGKDWRPDQLAGFKVGDFVRLPNIAATLQVIDLQPPAMLILRAPSGHELRAGWRAVERIRTRNEISNGSESNAKY